MYLFHNTADAVLPGNNGLSIDAPGSWKQIYARNNIWSGTDYALDNYNASQPVDLDYDNLWNENSGDLVRWDDIRYAALTDFAVATGQESHGLSVEPAFAGAGGEYYALDSGSDLIDACVVIPGITDDYFGAAPDIGACEYQGYGFALAVIPSVCTVDPGGVATYTIGLEPVGGFTRTVTLTTASLTSNLTFNLIPTAITPPGQATLTVTDACAISVPLAGQWYSIPITATGGGLTRTAGVWLLVGVGKFTCH